LFLCLFLPLDLLLFLFRFLVLGFDLRLAAVVATDPPVEAPVAGAIVVADPGAVVTDPGTVVTDPGAVVKDPGVVVTDPGAVVEGPAAVVLCRVEGIV